MPHQAHIHPVQIQILASLLFVPKASFSELMKQTELDSDHFNFHLQALVKLGYIAKDGNTTYTLTAKGKEHANKIDTDNNTIERQPKVTVFLTIIRHTDQGPQLLLQQRLKQPFYGFWCKPGGKIRWGETILQTAQRELLEETGLTCAQPAFNSIYHKVDCDAETGQLLEDKIFFEVVCENPEGQLIEEFPGGRNKFVNQDEISTLGKLFEGIDKPIMQDVNDIITITEKKHYYTPDEY